MTGCAKRFAEAEGVQRPRPSGQATRLRRREALDDLQCRRAAKLFLPQRKVRCSRRHVSGRRGRSSGGFERAIACRPNSACVHVL